MTGYRIIQEEIHETAGIVYEIAERAAQLDGEYVEASLVHEEEPHYNLSRLMKNIPSVPRRLQFRRPGGGGYVIHDGTYCRNWARTTEPKRGVEQERYEIGWKVLDALSEVYENTGFLSRAYIRDREGERSREDDEKAAYYNPKDGDIYVTDRLMPNPAVDTQIAGIGLADLQEEFGDVIVGRVCMYPEKPESADRIDIQNSPISERAGVIPDFDQVRRALEQNPREKRAEKFVSEANRERGEDLQLEEGSRRAQPCF